MKNFIYFTKLLIKEIFQVSLVSYFAFYLLESLKPGFVTNYINLNHLLILTILSGGFTIFFFEEKASLTPKKVLRFKDFLFIIFLAVLACLFIFYKTKNLGWLSWVISLISGVIIFLISILLLKEKNE